jgi:HD-like signal output (HDOD) protein
MSRIRQRNNVMDLSNRLIERIYHDYSQGRLTIPSLPETVLRVRQKLDDPDADSAELANLVKADAALTGRLLRIANSPIFRGTGTVYYDCERAITRIGQKTIRNLIAGIALRELFQARTPLIRERMKGAWKESIEIAAIASILARGQTDMDINRALLAGLVHNIGLMPILRYADDYPELAVGASLDAAASQMGAELGVFVLKTWRFDPDLITIPLDSADWMRDPGDTADYADVVLIARAHRALLNGGRFEGPRLTEMPAMKKLNLLRLGPAASVATLLQAKDDIAAVVAMLEG